MAYELEAKEDIDIELLQKARAYNKTCWHCGKVTNNLFCSAECKSRSDCGV